MSNVRDAGSNNVLAALPLTTLTFLGVNVAIYVIQGLFKSDVGPYAMNPALVVFGGQYWRLVTSALCHLSLLHIAMNMSSLYYMGISIERSLGSLPFFLFIVAAILLSGVLYTAISMAAWPAVGWGWMMSSAAGFSGVLFSMAAQECFLTTAETRSLFGMVNVPTRWYPWVLLVVLSVMLPGVSFLGHLAGLLVGFAHVSGWLRWILPSHAGIKAIEEQEWFQPIRRLGAYQLAPDADPIDVALGRTERATWQDQRNNSGGSQPNTNNNSPLTRVRSAVVGVGGTLWALFGPIIILVRDAAQGVIASVTPQREQNRGATAEQIRQAPREEVQGLMHEEET